MPWNRLRPKISNINPFGLRMPSVLKYALMASAHQNGRSLNSEIVDRLEKSVANEKAN